MSAKQLPLIVLTSRVLEDVHYIQLPTIIDDTSVPNLQKQVDEWAGLSVQMHVFDFSATTQATDTFFKTVKIFADKIKPTGARLISLHLSDALFAQVKSSGAQNVFSRVKNVIEDLQGTKKQFTEVEIRRLLFKSLANGAFKAVEVALSSTVSCDENYSVKAEDVPLEQFDVISVIEVNNDFLKADFRLLSSLNVLDKLCRAMHGQDADVDQELLESMAMELLNLIYGHAKSNLNDKESFRLPAAIPKLLKKNDFYKVKRSNAANLTIMPVVTPMGSFYVEVDFRKS